MSFAVAEGLIKRDSNTCVPAPQAAHAAPHSLHREFPRMFRNASVVFCVGTQARGMKASVIPDVRTRCFCPRGSGARLQAVRCLVLGPGTDMKRRQFITLLSCATVMWPLATRAQQGEALRRIGVLMSTAADDKEGQARLDAFLQGLQELGWTPGENIKIEI